MSKRVLAVVACVSAVASGVGLEACSSDEAPTVEAADAASPATNDAHVEAPDAEAPCDPDADLLAEVLDASIVDGASTTGICVGCMRASCAEPLAACARNCQCQGIMGDAIECYLTTQQLACAGRLTNYLVTQETRAAALTLMGCVRSSCPEACAVDGGAAPASGDAAAD